MPNYYEQKISLYSKLYRAALLTLAIVSFFSIVVGVREVFLVGRKIDITTQQIQLLIESNQTSTLEARAANVSRQEDLKNYVKCVVLLRYDNPNLTASSPRDEVEAALDKCAVNE